MSQCHLQLYRLLLDESNGLSHTVLAVSTADAVDDTSAAVSDDITADTTTADVDDTVADVDTAIAGTDNTIANADKTATDAAATDDSMFYNIAMFDVSASMSACWDTLQKGWNAVVGPVMTGSTDIYTFGECVKHRRKDVFLEESDFDHSCTNLTAALEVINEQVSKSLYSKIRVFLVTDGDHNHDNTDPADTISLMAAPAGKTVEVYLLGVGSGFPVQYSIDIRSRLHTGSASCPTLFWCKMLGEDDEMENEFYSITEEIKKGLVKVELSIEGRIVPNIEEAKSEATSGEFIYYDQKPENILNSLKVTRDSLSLEINKEIKDASAMFLVRNLYKQWNSVLIQQHRKKEVVPMENFTMMEKAFKIQLQKLHIAHDTSDVSSLRKRMDKKWIKTLENEFATQMNQSRNMISIESKYKDEIEMAEAILKTTVQSRFDTKLLNIRGHSDQEWQDDTTKFKELYLTIESEIKSLPPPDPEDCCRIVMSSFLSDLQDPDLYETLDQSKADFLSTFTFTGIPILAPVRDSSQINAWTIYIKDILVSPFEIISQRALESSFAVGVGAQTDSADREVTLQAEVENTTFNAIVPIIPIHLCSTLKKLVRTNLFSVGATFCILKNALIVDHNCHLAALGCVWSKTITDNPSENRPFHIKSRLKNIECTASLYMDRNTITKFIDSFSTRPSLCMMTETDETEDGINLKCESIIKVMFLMHMARDKFTSENPSNIIQMVLTEFLGRCLTNYEFPTPYMNFVTASNTEESRYSFLENLTQKVIESLNYSGEQLLADNFCREDVKSNNKQKIADKITEIIQQGGGLTLTVGPNRDKIKRLRNGGSAGNIGWEGLQAWAAEFTRSHETMGQPVISKQDLDTIFSDDMMCSYIHHALQYRQSRARWSKDHPLDLSETALEAIKAKLTKEQDFLMKTKLQPLIEGRVLEMWKAAYLEAHEGVARPMTRQQVMEEAKARGVVFTEENFDKMFRYRANVGLCRKCCHVETCPHFLKPSNRFNCHLETERGEINYPHKLHLTVSSNRSHSTEESVRVIEKLIDDKTKLKVESSTNDDNTATQDQAETADVEPIEMYAEATWNVYPIVKFVEQLKQQYDSLEI